VLFFAEEVVVVVVSVVSVVAAGLDPAMEVTFNVMFSSQ
jgi:hypothetical protein